MKPMKSSYSFHRRIGGSLWFTYDFDTIGLGLFLDNLTSEDKMYHIIFLESSAPWPM